MIAAWKRQRPGLVSGATSHRDFPNDPLDSLQADCSIDAAEAHAQLDGALHPVRHRLLAHPLMRRVDGLLQISCRMESALLHLQHGRDYLDDPRSRQSVTDERLGGIEIRMRQSAFTNRPQLRLITDDGTTSVRVDIIDLVR